MIPHVFRRRTRSDTISTLYGMIVAQARLPCFYSEYAVPDTVNGRFDLLILHLNLVLERLFADSTLRDLGQGLFDRFCEDMDDNLREMGVGDLTVPKEMRRIGDAFYGRAQAYRAAFAGQADELAKAISRNVYGQSLGTEAAPRRLAAYIRQAHHDLTAQKTATLATGEIGFPDPLAVVAG
jgi:cytochrome b pre-mRNA-processing protein 3